jgi:hypothetical protein
MLALAVVLAAAAGVKSYGFLSGQSSSAVLARIDKSRLHSQEAEYGYRSVITNPLRSAATISPDWKPDNVSTAPF